MTTHWTDETDAEAVPFFDSLSTAEIRRRQDLCAQQKSIAYEQGNGDAMRDLDRMDQALTDAMLRRMPVA